MLQACTITWETLLNYHEGRLKDSEADMVAAHLGGDCPNCTARRQWLTEVAPLLPAALETAPFPSSEALARVRAMARFLPQLESSAPLPRFVATLLSGTVAASAPIGARGATRPTVHHVFSTDTHLITVWDESEEGATRYLIAQIYHRAGGAILARRVTLFSPFSNEQVAVQEGNELHWSAVAPGMYLIHVRLESGEIFVPDIPVGME